MRLFFVFLLAIVMFGQAAPAAFASTDDASCTTAACLAYHNANHAGKRPSNVAKVCFYLEQDGTEAVPLFLHDATGKLINADPSNPALPAPNHRQVKQATDSYCIGRHFVEAVLAAGGWVDLCNGHFSSTHIEGDVLRKHLEAGEAPQSLATTVCLMDGPACNQRLAQRQVPE